MIRLKQGDILQADAEALVNTVNTQGVMGKGLAFAFKQRFPENYRFYREQCKAGNVQIGKVLIFPTHQLQPQYIINFPTKRHWRERSRLEYIQAGLEDLVRVVQEQGIRSIAIPPLGCGQGGLDWVTVRRVIEEAFEPYPDVEVQLYEPSVPQMTPLEASIIQLVAMYSEVSPGLTREELELLTQIVLDIDDKAPTKRGRRRQRTPTPKQLAQRLIRIPLLEAERVDGERLYGTSAAIREQAQRILEASPEWAKRTQQAIELIQGVESLAGLKALHIWITLNGNPPVLRYLRSLLDRVPAR